MKPIIKEVIERNREYPLIRTQIYPVEINKEGKEIDKKAQVKEEKLFQERSIPEVFVEIEVCCWYQGTGKHLRPITKEVIEGNWEYPITCTQMHLVLGEKLQIE